MALNKTESDYDPTKKQHNEYRHKCKFRYDDVRPNRGKTRLGRLGKESPSKIGSGGAKALIGRCRFKKHGNRKCTFPELDHFTCPFSPHPKKKKKHKKHK